MWCDGVVARRLKSVTCVFLLTAIEMVVVASTFHNEIDAINKKLGFPDKLWGNMGLRFVEVALPREGQDGCQVVPWNTLPPPECTVDPPQYPCNECAGLDVLVTSPGGTGSTYTLLQMSRNRLKYNSEVDKDGLKHKPKPVLPRSKPGERPLRSMYIFGTPKSSIYSHFRRNWMQLQSFKMTGCNGLLRAYRKKGSFPRFAHEVRHDLFRFGEHLLRWLYDPAPYDRIFLYGLYQDALSEVVDMALRLPPLPGTGLRDSCSHVFYVLDTNNQTFKKAEHHPLPTLSRAGALNLDMVYGCMEQAISTMPLILLKPASTNMTVCPTVPACLPATPPRPMVISSGRCTTTY
mmetsp:Transcript_7753/g.22016  ORF Transcript_7753/g.22016 Transcript_7753/m.22016 type:complete len:348 (+) Transcript_7753:275-1318(+)|eukprot:CAMPEP_0119129354 /NCGR_PEP_ID=MMETSP1310-20130426/7141_1 /TAXON_ID=464262 /ORGANISM="Genus nov. species nov., Strain RCC2339" /LENGTH=347 /DNA_ID=CAMNT_0007119773 /DNA_START=192 /DNA_END=1235 /DNA_ORIENTATION=-